MSKVMAKIYFNGRFIAEMEAFRISAMTKELMEECYRISLITNMQKAIQTRIEELKRSIKTKSRYDGEATLIQAFNQALEKNKFDRNMISLISLDVLDAMLPNRKNPGGPGWWRVLERKTDMITNKGWVFVPAKKSAGTPRGVSGKHGEGFMLDASRFTNLSNRPHHRYSIKDKRYVTRFKSRLVDDTIMNKVFGDRVMNDMCKMLCFRLKGAPGKEQEAQSEGEE